MAGEASGWFVGNEEQADTEKKPRGKVRKRSFLKALESKYTGSEETESLRYVKIVFHGKPKSDASSQLGYLRNVVLADANIAISGLSERSLKDVCPHVVDLDISGNLFDNWKSVLLIVSQLENLKYINLSQNPLKHAQKSLGEWTKKLPHVENLVLNDTEIPWTDVHRLAELFSQLKELHICGNGYSKIPDCNHEGMESLETLRLNNNQFKNWEEIWKLKHLPKLKTLILSGNPLEDVYYHDNHLERQCSCPDFTANTECEPSTDEPDGNNVKIDTCNSYPDLRHHKDEKPELFDECVGIPESLLVNITSDKANTSLGSPPDSLSKSEQNTFIDTQGTTNEGCSERTSQIRSDNTEDQNDNLIERCSETPSQIRSGNTEGQHDDINEGCSETLSHIRSNNTEDQNDNLNEGCSETPSQIRSDNTKGQNDDINAQNKDHVIICDTDISVNENCNVEGRSCDNISELLNKEDNNDRAKITGTDNDTANTNPITGKSEGNVLKEESVRNTDEEEEQTDKSMTDEISTEIKETINNSNHDSSTIGQNTLLSDEHNTKGGASSIEFNHAGESDREADNNQTLHTDDNNKVSTDTDQSMTFADKGDSFNTGQNMTLAEHSKVSIEHDQSIGLSDKSGSSNAGQSPSVADNSSTLSTENDQSSTFTDKSMSFTVTNRSTSVGDNISTTIADSSGSTWTLAENTSPSVADNICTTIVDSSGSTCTLADNSSTALADNTSTALADNSSSTLTDNSSTTLADSSNKGCLVHSGSNNKPFETLENIWLSETKIGKWKHLAALSGFPALVSVRMKDVKLGSKLSQEDRRKLFVPCLPNIKHLNGSEVTTTERDKGERYLLRYFCDKPQKPAMYYVLEKQHGTLTPLVDVDLSRGYKEWVTLTFYFQGDVVFKETMRVRQPVGKLRLLAAEKLCLYASLKVMKIYHKYCNSDHQSDLLQTGELEPLVCDTLPLSRFDIMDGDEIHIDVLDRFTIGAMKFLYIRNYLPRTRILKDY